MILENTYLPASTYDNIIATIEEAQCGIRAATIELEETKQGLIYEAHRSLLTEGINTLEEGVGDALKRFAQKIIAFFRAILAKVSQFITMHGKTVEKYEDEIASIEERIIALAQLTRRSPVVMYYKTKLKALRNVPVKLPHYLVKQKWVDDIINPNTPTKKLDKITAKIVDRDPGLVRSYDVIRFKNIPGLETTIKSSLHKCEEALHDIVDEIKDYDYDASLESDVRVRMLKVRGGHIDNAIKRLAHAYGGVLRVMGDRRDYLNNLYYKLSRVPADKNSWDGLVDDNDEIIFN